MGHSMYGFLQLNFLILIIKKKDCNIFYLNRGGRVAITMALRQVPQIEKLVVVDAAPVNSRMSPEFVTYIDVMKKIEQAGVVKQSKADEIMKDYISVGLLFLINYLTYIALYLKKLVK